MNENTSTPADIFARLAAPFHPDDLEWRAGATNGDKTQALALAYLTARAVMDRLDEVLSPENWRDEYQPGPDGGIICGLSLRRGDEWITKWDGAENTQFEEVKGGLSGAFKRAAVKWGVGRYLYRLPNAWVPCEVRGKQVVLKATPPLPAWALPEGEVTSQTSKTPEPPAGKNGNGHGKVPVRHKSWKQEVVLALIGAGLAGTPPEAVQLLNQSEVPADINPAQAVAWFRLPVAP